MAPSSDKMTVSRLLVPLAVMAGTMFLLFAFQMTQIMRDRDALHQTIGRQEKPLEESEKLNAQFGGLVVGTQKLAMEGNKSAKPIVERLKQIGVIPPQESAPGASPAPVPGAMEPPPPPGPVKP